MLERKKPTQLKVFMQYWYVSNMRNDVQLGYNNIFYLQVEANYTRVFLNV